MTPGVDVLEADGLRMVEVAAPTLTARERAAMDRLWSEAVRANPSLFDGPVAVCGGLTQERPGRLVVSWARTTYRHFALRRVGGAPDWRALFVSVVQPTDDGRVLVGRMSPSTASPGRWQFPGGTVEPPDGPGHLDEAALRRHAARELAEETGLGTPCEELTRWVITRGARGQIGVLHQAPPRPESELRECFAALTAAETALGREPELDRIALIRRPADLAGLAGPHVEYLEPVLRHGTMTDQGLSGGSGRP